MRHLNLLFVVCRIKQSPFSTDTAAYLGIAVRSAIWNPGRELPLSRLETGNSVQHFIQMPIVRDRKVGLGFHMQTDKLLSQMYTGSFHESRHSTNLVLIGLQLPVTL
jgi:hypothetical protein